MTPPLPLLEPSRLVPFENSRTFQRYGPEYDVGYKYKPPPTEHPYTKSVLDELGYTGLPSVISAAELDICVRRGEVELYRGLNGQNEAAFASMLRYGDMWAGGGGKGGGIYAAGGPKAFEYARAYAQDGQPVIVRMTLMTSARVADAVLLNDEMTIGGPQRALGRPQLSWSDSIKVEWARRQVLSVYAATEGYDAILESETGSWLILNRRKLHIQRENVEP